MVGILFMAGLAGAVAAVVGYLLYEGRRKLINRVNLEVSGKIIDWKYERAKKAAEKERSERQ
jgi:hypothetical protein